MSVPAQALCTYERLREQVLSGEAHPEGLSAILYHGMLRGLTVILTAPPAELPGAAETATFEAAPLDREFLHLLVNMVLKTQSQVTHVY